MPYTGSRLSALGSLYWSLASDPLFALSFSVVLIRQLVSLFVSFVRSFQVSSVFLVQLQRLTGKSAFDSTDTPLEGLSLSTCSLHRQPTVCFCIRNLRLLVNCEIFLYCSIEDCLNVCIQKLTRRWLQANGCVQNIREYYLLDIDLILYLSS